MSKRIRKLYFLACTISLCFGVSGIIIFYASDTAKYIAPFLIMFFLLRLSINQAIYFLYTRDILSEKVLKRTSNTEIKFFKIIGIMMFFTFFSLFCFSVIALMSYYGMVPYEALDYSEVVLKYLLIAIFCFIIVIVVLCLFRKKIR